MTHTHLHTTCGNIWGKGGKRWWLWTTNLMRCHNTLKLPPITMTTTECMCNRLPSLNMTLFMWCTCNCYWPSLLHVGILLKMYTVTKLIAISSLQRHVYACTCTCTCTKYTMYYRYMHMYVRVQVYVYMYMYVHVCISCFSLSNLRFLHNYFFCTLHLNFLYVHVH